MFLLGVMATACIGKFVGGGVAARVMGVSGRQSLALATLMNTRGLTELVILNVGRSAGLIGGQLFTMMVIMAIVTTVAAGCTLGGNGIIAGPVVISSGAGLAPGSSIGALSVKLSDEVLKAIDDIHLRYTNPVH